MRTSRFNGRFALVQIAYPLTTIHYNPWNADTPLFRKADKFFGPFSTWTVHNSLNNADAHLPLTQVCQPPLIDSTTGHYNSIGSHSFTLWSAFLASIQQGRGLERAVVALNSTGMHCHAYRKYTGSLWNTDASIIQTRNSSPMVSAIEGFHCSTMSSKSRCSISSSISYTLINAFNFEKASSIGLKSAVVSDVITTLVVHCFISGVRRPPTMVLTASTRASPSGSLLALLGWIPVIGGRISHTFMVTWNYHPCPES